MLKFLEHHEAQSASNKKSPIKYRPQMVYGISVQAPAQFQTPHTLIYKSSYINPYLKFEKQRQAGIPPNKMSSIHPKWTSKTDLHMIEEHKIITSQPQLNPSKIGSRYRQSYHQQFNQNKNRFMITKGEFSNFIQKNNHYKSVGPLHGEERTNQRITKTKESVWLASKSKLNLKNRNNLNQSLQKCPSIMSQNSSLFTQKTRIRCNRQTFNQKMRQILEARKNNRTSHHNFQLPKLGGQMTNFYRPLVTIYGRDTKMISADSKEVLDLDTFEQTLSRKFK